MKDVIVQAKNLGKVYQGYKGFLKKREVLALKELNLEIKKGEVFGLLGLNAAGKSTALKIFLGFISSSWGEFEILGRKGVNAYIKQRIGFLPENPGLYAHLSAEEFLDFCGRLFKLKKKQRRERVEELLETVGLSNTKGIRIREFSKGMVQRLGIASSLMNNPELIFLDEPMSGLDPLGRKKMKDIILELRRKGTSIFLSSHILAEVEEICDRVGILHKGKLICLKDVGELKKEKVSLEEFFIQAVEEVN
jgi:ABC-2 type transport system ATP-binding protein